MSNQPHGGSLIRRYADPFNVDELVRRTASMKSWFLTERELSDLEMIASGAFSPLTGFLGRSDYKSVLDNMRLARGLPWTLPVNLAVSESFGASLRSGEEVALLDATRKPIAICTVGDVYEYNPLEYAHKVFKTTDEKHPGVAELFSRGPKFIGGEIVMLRRRDHAQFTQYRLDPVDTRERFDNMGWKTIAGFQTRHPVHRAHEYIQKCALETMDGLFLHAVTGDAKNDDVPADVRMRCYEALIDSYFPKKRVLLAVDPAYRRSAGPREAVFHAIVRKNYGCTHFIVERDHAGTGNFYGPFEAQEAFSQFEPKELGITPLFFDGAFYCKACGTMATAKTCAHTEVARVTFSESMVLELLQKGKPLPQEFTRAEVGVILMEAYLAKKGNDSQL
jgi:sulfate adenylyltransferase